jgi:glycosyltransferase involved in cell wall biosynthesis
MRVAVVHNLRNGGAHRRLREQIARFESDVVEICLDTAAPVTLDPLVVETTLLAAKVPPLARPPLRYLDLSTIVRAWRRVRTVLKRRTPDVLFANPCQFLQSPLALLRAPCPSLYFCDEPRRVDYDDAARVSRARRSRELYAPLFAIERRLDRRAARAASAIVTNSRYTAGRILTAYGRLAEPVALGVAPEFSPAASVPRHILSVGTLIPSKGHDLAIEAVALTSVRLPVVVIAPRDDPSERARLEALAQRQGVDLRVRCGVPEDALLDAYRHAFVTLYLARQEPLGLASMEAQASGSPVIVSDEGGLPETVVEGRGGWAVPRDASVVAARIDRLGKPGVREAAVRNASQNGERWSWDASARWIETRLENLCA